MKTLNSLPTQLESSLDSYYPEEALHYGEAPLFIRWNWDHHDSPNNSGLSDVKPVVIHHFDPSSGKIAQEPILCIICRVNLGKSAQL
jgi:hypothetical protein